MIYYGQELYHHGIKGQKWGERRFQYEDGSLTPEGEKRYGIGDGKQSSSKATVSNSRESGSKERTYGYDAAKKRGIKLEDMSLGKTIAGNIFKHELFASGVSALGTVAGNHVSSLGLGVVGDMMGIIGNAGAVAITIHGVTDTVKKAKMISAAKRAAGK